jgi:hypothetical protein
MKIKSAAIASAFLLMAFPASVPVSFALEGGGYQTPGSWNQHHSFGGGRYNTGGVSVGGGNFDLSLTSRTVYRSFKDDVISEYGYIRMKLSDLEVASGMMSAGLYLRGAIASEGFNTGFNPLKDSLYSEREANSTSLRIYLANVSADGVVPNTLITVGRQYINHIDVEHADGADANVFILGEKLVLNAFYALPVSYYADSSDTTVYGGGIDARPFDNLRLRGEYVGYHDDKYDFRNNLFKFRADGKIISTGGSVGTVYLNYKLLDSVNDAELGTVLDFKPVAPGIGGTTLTGSVRMIDSLYDEKTTNFINRYNTSLGQEGNNTILSGQVVQGVFDWLAVSIGGERKVISGGASYAHREFSHVFGSIDLINLIDGIYIQLNGDNWLAPEDGKMKEEGTFQFGGQVTYSMENSDVWAGTSFQKYYYHIPEEFTGYTVIHRKSYEEDGRSFYIGGEYRIDSWGLAASFDVTFTSSSIYQEGGFNNKEDITAQLNLNWAL